MLEVILYSTLSGVIGTSIGGLIGIIFGKISKKTTSFVLSFAGGIMLSIVFFDLIPEANEHGSIFTTLSGIIWGIAILLLINYFLDNILARKNHKKEQQSNNATVNQQTNISSIDGKTFSNNSKKKKKTFIKDKSLLKTGIIMFLAIAFHNFPEGLAIGAMGSIETQLALNLAILMCIHDIPEGMAISAPLASGGLSRKMSVFLSFLAGITTVLGAVCGILIGSLSSTATSFSLALAAGAMLYVTIFEIIPESVVITKSKTNKIMLIVGLLLGYLVINVI